MAIDALERAPVGFDPIGAAAAWMLAPICSIVAVGYAVVQTGMHETEIVHPALAFVAVALLAVAGAFLSVVSHPSIGRLDRSGAILVVVLALAAAVLSAVAMWGHNRMIQDDWGQIGVALLLLGLLWLRPPGETLLLGVVSAVAVGVLAAVQTPYLAIVNTPYVYAVVAATPVLVFAAVSATNGAVIARFGSEWTASARQALTDIEPELRSVEETALHRAQLEELRRATLPLLASIAARGTITTEDIAQAARVSAQLREHAIEQLHVTWIDTLAASIRMPPQGLVDPDHLVHRLPAPERAAVSACLIELVRLGLVEPKLLSIAAVPAPNARSSERVRFEVSASDMKDWRQVRRTARPFLSVLRSLSGDAKLARHGAAMTLGFGYEPE